MKVENVWWSADEGATRIYVQHDGRLGWFPETIGRRVAPDDLRPQPTPLGAEAFVEAAHLVEVAGAPGGIACLRTWGLEVPRKYERQQRYNDANTTQVTLRLNLRTEKDIIDRLRKVGNKQGYLKGLVRADIERQGGK